MELSREMFEFLNRPLMNVDAVVTRFAGAIGGRLDLNYHGQPSRRIFVRQEGGGEKMISLSPITAGDGATEERPQYGLGIAVVYDTSESRTWWVEKCERLSITQMTPDTVAPLLKKAWKRLKGIDFAFLKAHGHTSTFPHIRRDDFDDADPGGRLQ